MKNNAAKKEFFIKSGDILIVVFIISFSLLVFSFLGTAVQQQS